MITRMRLRAGAAIRGRLSRPSLCLPTATVRSARGSTTRPQRRARLPPAAPTAKSPAQRGIL